MLVVHGGVQHPFPIPLPPSPSLPPPLLPSPPSTCTAGGSQITFPHAMCETIYQHSHCTKSKRYMYNGVVSQATPLWKREKGVACETSDNVHMQWNRVVKYTKHIHKHTHLHSYTQHTHIHTYIHVHTHTHTTHTYLYTHTHTHTRNHPVIALPQKDASIVKLLETPILHTTSRAVL